MINISLDPLVTGRAEALLFESGTSFRKPAFPTIQIPSSQHWTLLPNFPVPASAFMGSQPVAREIRSPDLNLLSQFPHFLTPCWNCVSSESSEVFHTALCFSVTLLGLPALQECSPGNLPLTSASRWGIVLRLTPGPPAAALFTSSVP